MKKLYWAGLLLVLAIAGINCRKEYSYSSSSAEYTSLDEFFQKNQPSSEALVANISNPVSLETKRGTKFIFEPNSFVNSAGQPVTGTIFFEVREILTPVDLILSRTLPMSNGEPLESGGEFMIKPRTQSGEPLKLAP